MDYKSLKKRVADAGGIRLAAHGSLRDQVVDLVVSEWPKNCPDGQLSEVLLARVSLISKKGHTKAYSAMLRRLILRPIVLLCVEWFLEKPSHRLLMEGWNAKKTKDL